MIRDRGTKKWQGFFMPEHIKMLKDYEQEDLKVPRPQLSEDQIEEMERLIAESLANSVLIELTTWKNGFINKRVGVVKKADPINKKIQILDELNSLINLDFFSIIKVVAV